MKILAAMLATAVATTVLGLPLTAIAQVGPDAHQPMPNDSDHRGESAGRDMHPGDMHRDDMHHDDMHRDDMRHDDRRHDDMGRRDDWHHDWHRHCWTQWRHHHRVRVCR